MLSDFYTITANFYNRNITINDIGGQEVSYVLYLSIPAYIANITSSNKQVFNGKEQVFISDQLTCAYSSNAAAINTSMVCTVGTRTFDVLGIFTTFKNHHLIVNLKEVASPQGL